MKHHEDDYVYAVTYDFGLPKSTRKALTNIHIKRVDFLLLLQSSDVIFFVYFPGFIEMDAKI